ncbi:MAG: N-acetylmuramoyl-L-alanine amidase [Planctomycetota bacterium]
MLSRIGWRSFWILGVTFLTACVSVDQPRPNPQTHLEAARDLQREGDIRGAISQYRLALGDLHGERRSQIEGELAGCYREVGMTRLSREHYQLALSSTTRSERRAEYSIALGELGLDESNLASASYYFTEAERLAPSDPDQADRLAFGLAYLAYEKDARKTARAHLDSIRRLTPFRTASLARSRDFHDFVYGATPRTESKPTAPRTSNYLAIHPRREWGARAMGANHDRMEKIWRITVHHTAMATWDVSRAGAVDSLQGIQRNHQQTNGWADIGYHYLIDRAGRIWEGRPVTVQGAHAGNSELNRGNIGIALLGNFDTQRPSDEQLRTLQGLLVQTCDQFSVQPENITGHRRIAATAGRPTECPGENLESLLPGLITRVRLALNDHPARTTSPSGVQLARSVEGPRLPETTALRSEEPR